MTPARTPPSEERCVICDEPMGDEASCHVGWPVHRACVTSIDAPASDPDEQKKHENADLFHNQLDRQKKPSTRIGD